MGPVPAATCGGHTPSLPGAQCPHIPCCLRRKQGYKGTKAGLAAQDVVARIASQSRGASCQVFTWLPLVFPFQRMPGFHMSCLNLFAQGVTLLARGHGKLKVPEMKNGLPSSLQPMTSGGLCVHTAATLSQAEELENSDPQTSPVAGSLTTHLPFPSSHLILQQVFPGGTSQVYVYI